MKQRFFIIVVLILLASGALLALNLASDKPNKRNNGFTRQFISEPLKIEWEIDISEQVKSFCGETGDTVFFSSRLPGLIYLFNCKNKTWDSIHLIMDKIPKLTPVFSTIVDYPMVYIFGENAKCIVSADLRIQDYSIIPLNIGAYKNPQLLTSGNIILSAVDTRSFSSGIKKISCRGDIIKENDSLLPQLQDAGFTYDGTINYDFKTNSLVHVCFYNNNITCFDTSLNQRYRAHTIDTFLTPGFEVRRVGLSITSVSPPSIVNKMISTYQGILFVNSKMKSDRENRSDFDNSTILDLYFLNDGSYIGSLRIATKREEKIRKFKVRRDNSLLAIKNRKLVSYSLESSIKSLLQ